MYVEDSNILFIGTSTNISCVKAYKTTWEAESEACTVHLPPALPLGAFQSLFPRGRCLRPLPSNAGRVSPGCGTSSPRLYTRSCWRPFRLRARTLSALCGASHGGTALTAGTTRPRPQCRAPCRAGRLGRGGAASPPPCREVAAAEGGSGGCSRCAGAGLRWRQASNAAAGLGVCGAPSSPVAFPARPARSAPLREAMLRPPLRPRRRRQVTAPRVPRPCPGAALCPEGVIAAPRASLPLLTARRGSAVTGCDSVMGRGGWGPSPGTPRWPGGAAQAALRARSLPGRSFPSRKAARTGQVALLKMYFWGDVKFLRVLS